MGKEDYFWTTMKTRIKELRRQIGLTQQELAKRVGVRRETIVFLEKGRFNPSLKLAHSIAEVFQTSIERIFIFEDSEKSGENEKSSKQEVHHRTYLS